MRMTKHHGFGNDFLVLLDDDTSHPLDAHITRALCDRHTGLGADGLIRATPLDALADDAVAAMDLRNADGSPAEMSGNGIRCLAQAMVFAGWAEGPTIPIRTDTGRRVVTLHDRSDSLTFSLSVEMGVARIDGEAPEWAGGPIRRTLRVDVGNPHLVFDVCDDDEVDDDEVDLVELGERVNAKEPGGANVHLLTAGPGDRVAIRTYERGVGLTRACGTGACAAAVAARAWGLVGDDVAVEQAGGTAGVTVRGDGAVVLRGPATLVATVQLPEGWPWR